MRETGSDSLFSTAAEAPSSAMGCGGSQRPSPEAHEKSRFCTHRRRRTLLSRRGVALVHLSRALLGTPSGRRSALGARLLRCAVVGRRKYSQRRSRLRPFQGKIVPRFLPKRKSGNERRVSVENGGGNSSCGFLLRRKSGRMARKHRRGGALRRSRGRSGDGRRSRCWQSADIVVWRL